MTPTTFALQKADGYIEYDTFLSTDFDSNSYANTIVNQSGTGDGSDVSTALAKLSFNIDSLNKQIQEQVVGNYEALLGQITSIKGLETILSSVHTNIIDLNESLGRLSTKIREPYNQLQTYAIQLENLQATSSLLSRLRRFLLLVRRLETYLANMKEEGMGERDMTAAALTLHELDAIMKETDFEGVDAVSTKLDFIKESREYVEGEASRLLKEGIDSQVQAKMAAGLQVLYNMKEMSQKVESITIEILDDLKSDIQHVVDMESLQKETRVAGQTASSSVRRVNNEPAFGNQSTLTQAVWSRVEALMQTMGDACIKIYGLEKVLELRKDSFTQVSFLEEVSKVLDSTSLVSYFWRVLSATFEKELKEATKVSTFLQNTFVGDYPRLLRLLYEFFSRVAMNNGTALSDYSQSPEYVIMLRSFGTFESGFLARSLTRMYDTVNATFPAHGGIKRSVPTKANVLSITRVIGSELETSAFEPHLSQAVAKNAVKVLNMFCVKCEGLTPTGDQPIYTAVPNNAIATYLKLSIELANILYFMHQSTWKVLDEYPEKTIDVVKQGAEDCRRLMINIGHNLVEAIKADADRVLLRMHQEDFSGQLRRSFDPEDNGSSTSGYMKELARHVRYYHSTILSRLSCGTEPKGWALEISKHIIGVFIFQVSTVRPLSEAGKLKLAGDMAELEFNVSQLMSEFGGKMEDIGLEYKALRAFRPLLFLDSAQLTAAHHTTGLSKLVLIHHLAVRSQSSSRALPLPHTVYDIPRLEYMNWMNRQTEKEAAELAMAAIRKGSNMSEPELQEVPEYRFMIALVDQAE
ncbi:Golgi transport complex subunit 5-domain-containing protein [Phycomyces blakesleeanus]|uniref:Conserved oligomeric Golgi complex subunit 5 n=2 Tax=Phycomyces blakesleeanus TaxID=4837 RepID=A0A162Q0F4_PHYB8|nr:hypothetical protein PHYBLDRAFT_180487 [Phycomyces blakesleeanus NRRL 1555(-)]OAD76026.1 hypothetical protein PHYBLDRAFT_180487 [Phycomyces blakesleeanus NRRL 1555(-)]|eukprot:XP_018294066.1 hypothetical protein PHYBLDRAFT_180487 [Phycomyces blakesleeanus NRRL 1555(-)]